MNPRLVPVAMLFCVTLAGITLQAGGAEANCPRKPGGLCNPPTTITTTTVAPPTTTSAPSTTTSEAPTTTTTPSVTVPVTSPPVQEPPYGGGDVSSIPATPAELPHTGNSLGLALFVGSFSLLLGLALFLMAWRREREAS